MPLSTVLLVLLMLLALGVIPHWGWSQSWGYGPSGAVGLLVVILIVLIATGRV